jgi:hypothetical protein
MKAYFTPWWRILLHKGVITNTNVKNQIVVKCFIVELLIILYNHLVLMYFFIIII